MCKILRRDYLYKTAFHTKLVFPAEAPQLSVQSKYVYESALFSYFAERVRLHTKQKQEYLYDPKQQLAKNMLHW